MLTPAKMEILCGLGPAITGFLPIPHCRVPFAAPPSLAHQLLSIQGLLLKLPPSSPVAAVSGPLLSPATTESFLAPWDTGQASGTQGPIHSPKYGTCQKQQDSSSQGHPPYSFMRFGLNPAEGTLLSHALPFSPNVP